MSECVGFMQIEKKKLAKFKLQGQIVPSKLMYNQNWFFLLKNRPADSSEVHTKFIVFNISISRNIFNHTNGGRWWHVLKGVSWMLKLRFKSDQLLLRVKKQNNYWRVRSPFRQERKGQQFDMHALKVLATKAVSLKYRRLKSRVF